MCQIVLAPPRRPLATSPAWWYAGTAGFALGFGIQIPTFPAFVAGLPDGSAALAGLLVGAFSAAAIAGRIPFLLGAFRGRSRSLLASGTLAAAAATVLPILSTDLVSLLTMRVVAGLGDALFLTVLLASALGGDDGRGQRRFAALVMVISIGFLFGPLVGEQVRLWFGYDLVWLTSAALLACGSLAALGEPGTPPPLDDGPASARGSWGVIAAIFGPYLAFAVAPAALTTYGGIAMHRAGASNSAALFLALSLTAILARLAIATGRLLPGSPTWSFATAAVGALIVAGATDSTVGLVVGSAVVGLAQGVATPASARQVVEHVPPERQRAAMAVSTISLDLGFLLAGAALGPVADGLGLPAVFAAAGVACVLATAGSTVAGRTLFNRPVPKEHHVAAR